MGRYGYLTNTKVKFILVTTDLDVRDADVRNVSAYKLFLKTWFIQADKWKRKWILTFFFMWLEQFFRRFHSAYLDAVSNPFHVPGKKITSKTFAERVSTIVKSVSFNTAGWNETKLKLCIYLLFCFQCVLIFEFWFNIFIKTFFFISSYWFCYA